MTYPVITNVDLGDIQVIPGKFSNDIFTAAGAGTTPAGTILARNTSTNKLIPFVKGGVADGNGIAISVLCYDVVATGAGDLAVRNLIEGEVDFDKLIIAADGDNSNVDKVVEDAINDRNILVRHLTENSYVDNQ